MRMGPPIKYKTEYCEMLINHMAEGLSYQSFAGLIGVSYKTLFEWEKDYPEFKEAKDRAKPMQLLWDERMLNKGIIGTQRGYNAQAHKWKMANCHKWTDRSEQQIESKNISINITSDESDI